MDKNKTNIITALKYYIPRKYWNLNDWDIIVKREEEVEEDIFKYKCSFYILYFNSKLEPVTYGRQWVINDEVYYDENTFTGGAGTYSYLGKKEWNKQADWGT